ncbi:Transcriptional corepressor LEUNIG-like protein [Drosera capensis]
MSQLNEMAEPMEMDQKVCAFSSEMSLKRYLLDYLKRREMHKTAAVFAREANVPESPVAIDSPPYGFLTEWWAIFSDAYFNKPESFPSRDMPSGSTKGKEIQNHHYQGPECSLKQNCSALSPAWGTDFDLVRQLNRHSLQEGNHFKSEAALSAVDDAFMLSLLEEAPVQTEANQLPSGFEHQEPSIQQELSAKYLAPVEGNFAQTHVGSSSSCDGNVMQLSRNSGKNAEVTSIPQQSRDRLPSGQQNQSEYWSCSRSEEGKKGDNRGSSSSLGLVKAGSLNVSKDKVLCVDFSSDGKLLACAGHDKKVLVWNVVNFEHFISEESHLANVTDLRFSLTSTIFATSSLDRAIRIWDAEKPNKSIFKLAGHNDQVTSLDFHPKKIGILSSCDSKGQIKIWNVNEKNCLQTVEGATRRIRFQPQEGKLLAGAAGSVVNVFDIETRQLPSTLVAHRDDVRSICWDTSGKYIATVSEDCVIVWLSSSADKYLHKLQYKGATEFQSCVFIPGHEMRLVIGGYKNLEVWSPAEGNKTRSIPAHGDLVAELACSSKNGFIASASHDHSVCMWNEC